MENATHNKDCICSRCEDEREGSDAGATGKLIARRSAAACSGCVELRLLKERTMKVLDALEESQESHQKHRDAATDEVTKMCHAGAADAYLHAKRRLQKVIWGETEF